MKLFLWAFSFGLMGYIAEKISGTADYVILGILAVMAMQLSEIGGKQ